MTTFAKKSRRSDEEPDINMIPIMNIFLVIIPFLLTSVSFFHIKAISTSVPVMADSGPSTEKQQKIKLTVIVQMQPADMRLSAIADELGPEDLKQYEHHIRLKTVGNYPLGQFNDYLHSIKSKYPASDTIILIPDNTILYDSIVQPMDAARYHHESPLFPNVVLSGSLG
jgi:biopolymer transport protein ExbD